MSASSLPTSEPGTDKRRTTRVVQAIPMVVRGMDALGQAFKESTSTVMVNCNGCKYRSRHYVPKNSRVTVEIIPPKEGAVSRIVPARVVWVQRPTTFREIFHVALEFEVPGNVWPVESPPKDWFPHPDDENLEVPLAGEAAEIGSLAVPPVSVKPLYVPPALNPEQGVPALQAAAPVAAVVEEPMVPAAPADRGMALVVPPPAKAVDPEHAAARLMVTAAVEAVIAKEMPSLREGLELRMQESIQEMVKSLAQSIADTVMKDLVHQASDATAALIVKARHACLENTEQLDERIREVLHAAERVENRPRKSAAAKGKPKARKRDRETVVTP